MPSGYIDDGYTLEETILAEEGFYDAVTVKYRPLLRNERWRHHKAVEAISKSETDLEKIDELTAELIATHLVEWDLKDRLGNVPPISKDTILRLQLDLYDKLIKVIMSSVEVDEEMVKN